MPIELPNECYELLILNLGYDTSHLLKNDFNIEEEVSKFFYEVQYKHEPPFSLKRAAKLIGIEKIVGSDTIKKGSAVLDPPLGEGKFQVKVSKEDNRETQRFFIAHEIGEVLLCYRTDGWKGFHTRVEEECDYIGRIVLMPTWDFKDRIKEVNDITKLAELYSCPDYTVEARFKDLNIISNKFQQPSSL